jgi:hypothetical protein
MDLLTADFESAYTQQYSLSRLTTEEYVRSPLFEVIGVGLKLNDGPTVWVPKPDIPKVFARIDWANTMFLAQNTMFDAAILEWRYGCKPAAYADILGMSRALFPHARKHSLEAQAERMGVGTKGDDVLRAIGLRFVDFPPEALKRYGRYCKNDVNLTYQLFKLYMGMGFPMKELKLIDLTLRMFVRPSVVLNHDKLEKHYRSVVERKARLIDLCRDALVSVGTSPEALQAVFDEGGLKKMLMSNDKFAALLESFGVEPPTKISKTTKKVAYAFAKTDEKFQALQEHPDDRVQALVAARLGNKTTLEETRTLRFIGASLRGPFPIPLRYYAALTGRWGGVDQVNMQNIPRKSPLKAAFEAPPGFFMCGADLSNIELRLGLWLAGQDDRLDLLRNGLDLYKDFATMVYNVAYDEVTDEQRFVSKTSNLALIFATGAARLREALRLGKASMPLEEVKRIVELYRRLNSRVVNAWRDGERALYAIQADQQMPLFRNGVAHVDGKRGIRLPSGLYIQFPNLRRETNEETGKAEWLFDSKNGPERTYGGKVFQGVDQSIARCIMADGLLRLQKHHQVVLTVHDAAYWLAPEAEAKLSLERGISLITQPVPYCPGLPLAAEGGYGHTMADCEPPKKPKPKP